MDPLSPKYPHYTPYSFSGNRVIDSKELEGLEPANAIEYINQKMSSIFSTGAQKAEEITNETTKVLVEKSGTVGLIVTGVGYVMYVFPLTASFAPAVVTTGSYISAFSTTINVAKDLQEENTTDIGITLGVTIFSTVTKMKISSTEAKALINKNDKLILEFATDMFSTSVDLTKNKMVEILDKDKSKEEYTPNLQKVGNVTFDSNKIQINEKGTRIATDLKTGKDYGVIRKKDGSYDFKRKSENNSEAKSQSRQQPKSQPRF